MKPSTTNGSVAPQGAPNATKGRGAQPHHETIRDSRFTIHANAAERERLLARAKEIEQRLDAYRDWRARQLAKEAELLDALKAHRAFIAKGTDRAYRLSAELSGIRVRLGEDRAPCGTRGESRIANGEWIAHRNG